MDSSRCYIGSIERNIRKLLVLQTRCKFVNVCECYVFFLFLFFFKEQSHNCFIFFRNLDLYFLKFKYSIKFTILLVWNVRFMIYQSQMLESFSIAFAGCKCMVCSMYYMHLESLTNRLWTQFCYIHALIHPTHRHSTHTYTCNIHTHTCVCTCVHVYVCMYVGMYAWVWGV
jgi:heme/copper-type cytochrome/quinol oxidase subunit 4